MVKVVSTIDLFAQILGHHLDVAGVMMSLPVQGCQEGLGKPNCAWAALMIFILVHCLSHF